MRPIYSARARLSGRRLYFGAAVAAASIRAVFKANLSRILAEKNVNQTKLAGHLGIEPKIISRWKKGTAFPKNADLIDKLVDVLCIHPEELFLDPRRLRLVEGGRIETALVEAIREALKSAGYEVEIKKPH